MTENTYWINASWIQKQNIKEAQSPTVFVLDAPTRHESVPTIYVQCEPECYLPFTQFLKQSWPNYKAILTYNQDVLDACPNAILCLFGTTTIDDTRWNETQPDTKEYSLSFLTSYKATTEAQMFRHFLYFIQDHITAIPTRFYKGAQFPESIPLSDKILELPNNDKYEMLKSSQFHIALENSSQTNYFTEKLLDALLTRNIPVYYGCSNIADFFDTTGWIILTELDPAKLLEQLNALTPDYYSRYLDVIEKNWKTAQQYAHYEDSVNKALEYVPNY